MEAQAFTSLNDFIEFKPSKVRAKASASRRGQLILLEKEAGGYYAILPMAGPLTLSYFEVDAAGLNLITENGGTHAVSGTIPLYA